MNRLTRRELAAALSTSAVLLARPQAQPTNSAALTPVDELAAARTQLRDNAAQLDKFPLPMAAEPATTFKP
jgi:hypothetical protein